MDMQKTRTIAIATLTFASVFILGSWIFPGFFFYEIGGRLGEIAEEFFFNVLSWGCFAVIPFAIVVFAAMWGWSVSIGWKILIVVLHVLFALGAWFNIYWWWLMPPIGPIP